MKMRKKSDLPTKICAHCARPMVWRKSWENVWEEVKYCSDKCRKEKSSSAAKVQKT
jgi:hypothetical protein